MSDNPIFDSLAHDFAARGTYIEGFFGPVEPAPVIIEENPVKEVTATTNTAYDAENLQPTHIYTEAVVRPAIPPAGADDDTTVIPITREAKPSVIKRVGKRKATRAATHHDSQQDAEHHTAA